MCKQRAQLYNFASRNLIQWPRSALYKKEDVTSKLRASRVVVRVV